MRTGLEISHNHRLPTKRVPVVLKQKAEENILLVSLTYAPTKVNHRLSYFRFVLFQ